MVSKEKYERREHAGLTWHVHPSFIKDFPLSYTPVPGPDDPAENETFLQRRKSGRSTLLVTAREPDRRDVVVKQYVPRSPVEHVKYLFSRTRAASEWKMNHMLSAHGIPTATVLAYGERRALGIWRRSVLILEALVPRLTLYDYMKAAGPSKAAANAAKEVARYVGSLHEAGFYYRDLHSENILMRTSPKGAVSVCFIDLHEVKQVGRTTRTMCVDDLGRLNGYTITPAANRVRFLKSYLSRRSIPVDDWKDWAREIDARSRELWDRHHRKRGNRIDVY